MCFRANTIFITVYTISLQFTTEESVTSAPTIDILCLMNPNRALSVL